jgi:hypothetical protein
MGREILDPCALPHGLHLYSCLPALQLIVLYNRVRAHMEGVSRAFLGHNTTVMAFLKRWRAKARAAASLTLEKAEGHEAAGLSMLLSAEPSEVIVADGNKDSSD